MKKGIPLSNVRKFFEISKRYRRNLPGGVSREKNIVPGLEVGTAIAIARVAAALAAPERDANVP